MKRLYYENAIALLIVTSAVLSAQVDTPKVESLEKYACLNVINSLRRNAEKTELTWNDKLAQAAKIHADSMAERNYFSHTDIYGQGVAERVTSTGYPWKSLGENLAIGEGMYDIIYAWKSSPAHNEIMYDGKFRECGVSRVRKNNKVYWVLVVGTQR